MHSKANKIAVSKAIRRRWKLWRQGKGPRPGEPREVKGGFEVDMSKAKKPVEANGNGHPTFETTLRERLEVLKSQVNAIESYLDMVNG